MFIQDWVTSKEFNKIQKKLPSSTKSYSKVKNCTMIGCSNWIKLKHPKTISCSYQLNIPINKPPSVEQEELQQYLTHHFSSNLMITSTLYNQKSIIEGKSKGPSTSKNCFISSIVSSRLKLLWKVEANIQEIFVLKISQLTKKATSKSLLSTPGLKNPTGWLATAKQTIEFSYVIFG